MSTINAISRRLAKANVFVVFVGGVATLAAVLLLLSFIYKSVTRDRTAYAVVNTQTAEVKREDLALRNISRVSGTTTVIAALEGQQKYDVGSYGKTASSMRNLYFYDVKSDTGTWLLPRNDMLVFGYAPMSLDKKPDAEHPVVAFVYEIVKADTNNDKRLSHDDQKTIAFSRADGSRYTEIVEGVASMNGHTVIDNNTVLVSISRKEKNEFLTIDLDSFQIKRTHSIAGLSTK